MKKKREKYLIVSLLVYSLNIIQAIATPASNTDQQANKSLLVDKNISTTNPTYTEQSNLTIKCTLVSTQNSVETIDIDTNVRILTDETGKVTFSGTMLQWLNKAGEPQIPWVETTLLLPPDTDLATIHVELTDSAARVLSGIKVIEPTPPLATWYKGQLLENWPTEKKLVAGRDIKIYQNNDYWPVLQIKSIRTSQIKLWKMVSFSLPFFSYNALQGELKQWERLHINVSFSSKENNSKDALGAPEASLLSPVEKKDRQKIIERIKKSVSNYKQAAPAYKKLMGLPLKSRDFASPSTTNNNQLSEMEFSSINQSGQQNLAPITVPLSTQSAVTSPGYAIITTTTIQRLSTAFSAFIKHKQSQGFQVIVATEENFDSGLGDQAAEHIRTWLKNNYQQYNINYVLLIGNPDPVNGNIPMKMVYPFGSNQPEMKAPTDYYYADLTGNWDLDGDGFPGEETNDFGLLGVDFNWEVLVGRIPYYDVIQDLDKILNKLISCETQPVRTSFWRDNILLINKPMDAVTPGWQLGEAIKNNVLIPNNFAYHRIYDEDYNLASPPETTPVSYESVTNVWNGTDKSSEGKYGLVVFSTHGWSEGGASVISTNQVPLLNDNYPGITFQAACDTAYPESANNLSYALLLNGGIGSVGATRYSWYYVGETYFPGSPSHFGVAYEFTKRLAGEQMTIGEALYDTKQMLAPGIWANMVVFNLYGDPSMVLPQLKILRVDLGSNDQEVPANWAAWNETAETGSSSKTFTALGGITINLTPSASSTAIPLKWYNNTNESAQSDYLLQNGVKTKEKLNMSIAGLPAGKYEITTYHYNPGQTLSTMDIFVKDYQSAGYRQVVDEMCIVTSTLKETAGATPDSLSTTLPPTCARFAFSANGTNPVNIQFAAGNVPGELVINGFEIRFKEPFLLVSNPGIVDFKDVTIGEDRTQGFTLINQSSGPLNITSLTLNDQQFNVSMLTLPITLQAGARVMFNLNFEPKQAGTVTDTLTFYTDTRKAPLLSINLSGKGTHTITLGDYNNKKTTPQEKTNIYFDTLVVRTDTSMNTGQSAFN